MAKKKRKRTKKPEERRGCVLKREQYNDVIERLDADGDAHPDGVSGVIRDFLVRHYKNTPDSSSTLTSLANEIANIRAILEPLLDFLYPAMEAELRRTGATEQADFYRAVREAGLLPGSTADVTVTKVSDFALFIRHEDGIEGIVHSSELPGGSPPEAWKEDQKLRARVMRVDLERKKVALSLRGVLQPGEGLRNLKAKAKRKSDNVKPVD